MIAQFEPAARQELVESARRYLAEAGAVHAAAFEEEARRIVELLILRPEIGTRGRGETRSMPLRRYPYSIHYRIEPGVIRILAVAHHSRRPGYWMRRARG